MFIPSKGRAGIIGGATSRIFPDAPVIVHNDAEAALYQQSNIPNPIIVSHEDMSQIGKSLQMRFVLNNFITKGEWVCFADDNLQAITAVDEAYYDGEQFPDDIAPALASRLYNSPVGSERLESVLAEMRSKAESVGANLCGFASTANYYFRRSKWLHVGWVIGQLCLIRKTELEIPIRHQDDTYITAEHLVRDGRVLINRFVFPGSPHFATGGHGTVAERFIIRTREVRELLDRYNGLFSIKNPPGMPKNQDVRLRLHTLAQIAKWREKLDSMGG